MPNYKSKVPVFFTVDDNYVPYLSITLKSLVDTSKKSNCYEIYIIHNELSNQSKRILRALIKNKENFTMRFFNISFRLQQLAMSFDVRDYYSISTYYRIFLANLFPTVKKALYLDSDIVIRKDVAELFNVDLGNNLLGAVPDASVQIIPEFQQYVNTVMSMPYQDYFNAGILVMDFKGLRTFKLEEKCIDLLSKVTFKVAQDQDILNFLTRGKVTFVDQRWNVMPLGERVENPFIVHYNLIFKPWRHKDIMYEEYFWDIADRLNIGVYLMGQLHMIPEEFLQKDFLGVEMVKKLCLEECKRVETYYAPIYTDEEIASKRARRPSLFLSDKEIEELKVPHNPHREEILKRIDELESQGKFDVDAEDDPPYSPLEPQGLDFLRKKFMSKVKTLFANIYSRRYFNHLIHKGAIVIDGYEGVENIKNLSSGAVVTANHFNPFDSIPIHKVSEKYAKRRKLFKVIREGNYSFPGLFGFFMRNCNTIPLSSNPEVLKKTLNAIDVVLSRGDLLLVYPEQSLWWNYRKPKPLKDGAFRFASKNNVPVVPTFITMRDTDKLDVDGYPIQAYTLHIFAPIYPDPSLTIKENVDNLKKENFRLWKELYEKTYGIPLKYSK